MHIAGTSWQLGLSKRPQNDLPIFSSARVAYTKVERQLKVHNIPCTYVNPATVGGIPAGLSRMQSSLINSIPALCVKSSDLLAGAEGVEAAMANIRIIPLHWWADQRMEVCQVFPLVYDLVLIGLRRL